MIILPPVDSVSIINCLCVIISNTNLPVLISSYIHCQSLVLRSLCVQFLNIKASILGSYIKIYGLNACDFIKGITIEDIL